MSRELIYESRNSRVLVQESDEMGRHVVKILNEEYPSPKNVNHFFNEYEVLKDIDIPGVRKVIQSGKVKSHHAIFLQYVDGVTLTEYLTMKPSIGQKLKVAATIASVIGAIHDKGIIHKDISSGNILVDPNTLDVHIIDFGISSQFNLKNQHLGNPERLEGTLTYVSPEQTGRMNRVVDYRTDLYSLGVVLYELFGGHPPFTSDDAMTLVHAHIASVPRALTDLSPEMPDVVDAIVQKLLSKNAEDRYQSAHGLRVDLETCKDKLDRNGSIVTFEIARDDYSGKFQLVQKLYGRDQEIAMLLSAYDRCAEGQLGLILVAGYSGTGKSSLVSEIHKPVTERRGYFVEGKFDQFQRAIPYFAFIQAFRGFVNLLLTEDEKKLDYFRNRIIEAVGEEGAVLTDVIPELELIIGKQPPVVEVGGSEAQNRFNYTFRRFVHALCAADHPLALFIDDLQWADSASLNLLKVLMTDQENAHLLCIGAYRDNEVSTSHPFIIAVNELREQDVDIEQITIGNLNHENVNNLISDSLLMPADETLALTDLVMEKTGGNAFFVTQFLQSLYEDGLLVFDTGQKKWTWDITTIRSHDLKDDVVELMAGKVLRAPEDTQRVLRLAACVGSIFDLSTLSYVAEEDEQQLAEDLRPALAEGLVLLYEEIYRFSHDRVQQAVYSLIPENERNDLHLKIGKLLLQRIPEKDRGDRLFDIVNQLNWGIDIITDEGEREQLAGLNLNAGIKAKESSAFEPAYDYIQKGIQLLREAHWSAQYDLSVKLYTEAAETAYLSGRFEEMNSYIDIVLERADHLIEKIKPYEIRIESQKAENRLPDALATGLDLMAKLGEKFPRKPNALMVMPDLIKTGLMLRGKSNEELRDLPEIQDPIKRAAIRAIATIAPSSYWANPNVFPFLIFRMVQLSIRHGNAAVSAFGYATYGVIMVGVLGLMKTGYRFGKLGLMIIDKYNAKEWIAQIYTPVYGLINIWNEHIRTTLKPLRDSYHIGLETGAIEFACINANMYCIQAYLVGIPLQKIEGEARDYSVQIAAFKQDTNHTYNEIFRQSMLNFMGESDDPTVLSGGAIEEQEMLHRCTENKNRMAILQVYLNKMMVCNYFGDFTKAWECAPEVRTRLDSVLAKLEVSFFHFHEAITAINLARMGDGNKGKLLRRARKNMRKMRTWAKHAPANYLHKWYLMRAEYLRATGKTDEARKAYDEAIQLASEHQYIHEEALACELAARLYREVENTNLSNYYLRNALQLYREWGAMAKVAQLTREFPEIVADVSRRKRGVRMTQNTGMTSATSTVSGDEELDLSTVLKASSSISGEIVLDNLLKTLLSILMENLGATRGVLMLRKDDEFIIRAQSAQGESQETVLDNQPVRGSGLIPESFVTYMHRKGEEVVVDHAVSDDRFKQDRYVQDERPLSMLGYPIMHKGDLIGIMYFENKLAEGAFTEERLELLSMLSGQIAVSIENALLYESLELKVEERTAQLAEEKRKSDMLLLNILPESTAEELKRHGKATPRRFENVTVMFTDFKDFTRISETMEPEELVGEIDRYFGAFDHIIEKYDLEKIKTIGDAYMCAGGLPELSDDHAERVIQAAVEIRAYMWEARERRETEGKPYFGIRIGIHTGPVVAGVVGHRKFAYDIWGDTVNTASRMETHCDLWQINVSGTTQALLKHRYPFHGRGQIEAKNKGKIDMYYLETPVGEIVDKQ